MTDGYDQLNTSELLEIIKLGTGKRLKKNTPRDRLLRIIREKEEPLEEELAPTSETRKKLEVWVAYNMDWVGTQLPCTGANKGKCTIYPCSDLQHIECYSSSRKFFL